MSVLDFGFCFATAPGEIAEYARLYSLIEQRFAQPDTLRQLHDEVLVAPLNEEDRKGLLNAIDYYLWDASREARDKAHVPMTAGLGVEEPLVEAAYKEVRHPRDRLGRWVKVPGLFRDMHETPGTTGTYQIEKIGTGWTVRRDGQRVGVARKLGQAKDLAAEHDAGGWMRDRRAMIEADVRKGGAGEFHTHEHWGGDPAQMEAGQFAAAYKQWEEIHDATPTDTFFNREVRAHIEGLLRNAHGARAKAQYERETSARATPGELVRGASLRSGKGRKGRKPVPAAKREWKAQVEQLQAAPVVRQQSVQDEYREASGLLSRSPGRADPGVFEPSWYARKVTRADVNARQMTRTEAERFASTPDEELPYAVLDRHNEVTVAYFNDQASAEGYANEHNERDAQLHVEAVARYHQQREELAPAERVVDDYWDTVNPSQGTPGGYLKLSGAPGSLFEAQHERIMLAGALIDAEVTRRMKPQRERLAAAKKLVDERKREVRALELEEEQAGWETVGRWLGEPDTPWEQLRDEAKAYRKEIAKRRWNRDEAIIRRGQRVYSHWENDRYRDPTSGYANPDDPYHSEYVEVPSPVQAIHDRWAAAKWGRDYPGGSLESLSQTHGMMVMGSLGTRRGHTYDVLREIRDFGGGEYNVATDANAETLFPQVTPFLPTDWITASNDHPTFLNTFYSEKRGHYVASIPPALESSGLQSEIRVSPSTPSAGMAPGSSTLLHELVHRAEHTRDGVRGAEWTFYASRTTGPDGELEPLVKLADLGLGRGYDEWEETRLDDFGSPYSGKSYGDGMEADFELLSMGIEDLVTQRHGLIEKDEEYRQFVLGSLALL